jgi:hypothetical protein
MFSRASPCPENEENALAQKRRSKKIVNGKDVVNRKMPCKTMIPVRKWTMQQQRLMHVQLGPVNVMPLKEKTTQQQRRQVHVHMRPLMSQFKFDESEGGPWTEHMRFESAVNGEDGINRKLPCMKMMMPVIEWTMQQEKPVHKKTRLITMNTMLVSRWERGKMQQEKSVHMKTRLITMNTMLVSRWERGKTDVSQELQSQRYSLVSLNTRQHRIGAGHDSKSSQPVNFRQM